MLKRKKKAKEGCPDNDGGEIPFIGTDVSSGLHKFDVLKILLTRYLKVNDVRTDRKRKDGLQELVQICL